MKMRERKRSQVRRQAIDRQRLRPMLAYTKTWSVLAIADVLAELQEPLLKLGEI
jgi:hypothetical protein